MKLANFITKSCIEYNSLQGGYRFKQKCTDLYLDVFVYIRGIDLLILYMYYEKKADFVVHLNHEYQNPTIYNFPIYCCL